MRIFEDFLDVREHALKAEYVDWPGYDGQVYKRVALTPVPGLHEAIERVCGPVDMLGMGYRLNYANELPNQAVHSDLGWGTHALVLYLCDGPGGTAFWRHKATGAERIDVGDTALMQAIGSDWDDESKWDMTGLCPLKRNRAVIYESALFHSRHPFAAFGDCPESGRLVAVAFFTPRG
jgi:hypothetical protein